MKKQLVLILFALFTSVQLFAQENAAPTGCPSSAAAPIVGETYKYEVTIPNTGGYTGTGTFDWYVMTQDQLDLLAGTHIPASNTQFVASGHYDTPTASAKTIDITWTAAALATAKPYFLVVVYEESLACVANNMKVYKVQPINTFWLKLDNITTTQCPALVSQAVLSADGTGVEYLYGTNTLTAKMTASGYTGQFDPQIRISGVKEDQTLAVTWEAAAPSTEKGTFTGSVDYVTGIWQSSSSDNQMPAVADGQEITITIVINNNRYETLLAQDIEIAVDGSFTSGSTTFKDLSDVNGACTPSDDFADAVIQTISARPTITPVNPPATVGFVPQVAP